MKTKFIKFCILNRIILIRSNKIKTTLYTNNIVISNKIEIVFAFGQVATYFMCIIILGYIDLRLWLNNI